MEKQTTDYKKTMRTEKQQGVLRNIFVYFLLLLWAVIVLFPFYWMLLTSVKSYGSYNAEHIPSFFTLHPTLQNYQDAFTAVPLGRYLANTLFFTIITTAAMLIVITLAAFAFARLKFTGKNLTFTLFLSLMMIPNELVIITNFVTITNLNMRNTFSGLILPSITSVFYIYLLKENFEQVPDELYRAAKVDGTSDLKYLLRVLHANLPPDPDYRHNPQDHRMLEFLCLATADYRRSELLSRLKRHSGDPRKWLWPGKHSGYDGCSCRDFRPAHCPVSDLSKQGHGWRFQRRDQGMKKISKVLSLTVATSLASAAFRLPRGKGGKKPCNSGQIRYFQVI